MVVGTEDDFGRSVESTLDVGVNCSTKTKRDESARSSTSRERRRTRLTLLMLETTASKVDNLDPTLRRMTEKDVLQNQRSQNGSVSPNPTRLVPPRRPLHSSLPNSFENDRTHLRLQITMHNPMMSHQNQTLQELNGESSNEGRRESSERVGFDEFVEVDAEEFGSDAEMVSEVEVFGHSDDVVFLFWVLEERKKNEGWKGRRKVSEGERKRRVENEGGKRVGKRERGKKGSSRTYPFPQIIQDLDLHQSLMMESLLIPDDLDRDRTSRTMISTLQNLTKRPFPQQSDDLVSIREMIVLDNEVISSLVVVAVVVGRFLPRRSLLGGVLADVVDGRVVDDFFAFEVGEGGVGGFDGGWKRRGRKEGKGEGKVRIETQKGDRGRDGRDGLTERSTTR